MDALPRRAATTFAALTVLGALAACTGTADYGPQPYARASCDRYDPVIAKRTFDGRVGRLVVRNATPQPVRVRVFHPDGDGRTAQDQWVLPAGADTLLGDGFGNDWGVQGDDACVSTVGALGEWHEGSFRLTWTGDSLRAGQADVEP